MTAPQRDARPTSLERLAVPRARAGLEPVQQNEDGVLSLAPAVPVRSQPRLESDSSHALRLGCTAAGVFAAGAPLLAAHSLTGRETR